MQYNHEHLLTEKQVAQILSCTVSALRKWRRERRGPKFTKLYRLIRYRDCDVASFVEQHLCDSNVQPVEERKN